MKIFSASGNPETLWQALSSAGLVQGEIPTEPQEEAHGDDAPWFVKAMLGAGAWLSSLLFLIFVGLLLGSLFRDEWTRAVLGLIACALAAGGFRRGSLSVFASQILFVLTLLGQALVLSAIFGWFDWATTAWLLTALFEAAILVAVRYPPNRFLSTLAVLASLHNAAFFWGVSGFFMPACLALLAWGINRQWRAPRIWSQAVLALCLVPFFITATQGLFMGLHTWRIGSQDFEFLGRIPFWVWRSAMIAVWLGIVGTLLKQVTSEPFAPKNAGAWLLAILLAAGTWPVPLALFALAVFVLGFSQRDRLLEGIGIAQLLWSVGHYYYAMQDTLLFKSLSLSALGAALLLLYAGSHMLLPAPAADTGEKKA